jgi:hypothetical protein
VWYSPNQGACTRRIDPLSGTQNKPNRGKRYIPVFLLSVSSFSAFGKLKIFPFSNRNTRETYIVDVEQKGSEKLVVLKKESQRQQQQSGALLRSYTVGINAKQEQFIVEIILLNGNPKKKIIEDLAKFVCSCNSFSDQSSKSFFHVLETNQCLIHRENKTEPSEKKEETFQKQI